MTKRMKMGYVEVEMQPACNLFPAGARARGHVYHFSEVVQVRASLHVRMSSLPPRPKHIAGLVRSQMQSAFRPCVCECDISTKTRSVLLA